MKKYTINVHFDMVITEEVIAKDYQSARNLAELQAQNKSLDKEAECYGVDSCLVEEEDLPLSSDAQPVKDWADIEKLLDGKVKKFWKFHPSTGDSYAVRTLSESLSVVGDAYLGTETLMEAELNDNRTVQVRKILTNGHGAAYRNRRIDSFVAQICKSNRWSESIEIDTKEGIEKFVELLS